eukprot:Sspe_Gene.18219::Locus_6535_Transcript_1_1_Confidence_1.000_Length_2368::g.18219::m.18219
MPPPKARLTRSALSVNELTQSTHETSSKGSSKADSILDRKSSRGTFSGSPERHSSNFIRIRPGSSQSSRSTCSIVSAVSAITTAKRLEAANTSIILDQENRKQLLKLAVANRTKLMAAKVADSSIRQDEFTWRSKVYCLFDPSVLMPSKNYMWASNIIAVSVLILILLSVIIFCVESLPRFHDGDGALFAIESVCVAVFTLEFGCRLITHPNRSDFARDVYNWIDLAAILPYYIDVIITRVLDVETSGTSSLVFLRLLRLIRVLRVMKLGKYSKPLQVVLFTLSKSLTALSLLVFLLGIATVLFASALFLAEQTGQSFDKKERVWIQDNGRISPFQSIPHTFWWAMVTLTTVGYGDNVPVTLSGKLVAAICIVAGLFVVAFPVILISHNFQEVMSEYNVMAELVEVIGDDAVSQDGKDQSMNEADEELLDATESTPTIPLSPSHGSPIATWTDRPNPLMPPKRCASIVRPPHSPGRKTRWADIPAPGSTASYFKLDDCDKSRAVISYAPLGDSAQFRYTPLFVPVVKNSSGDFNVQLLQEPSIGVFLLMLEVILDSEKAQDRAYASLYRSNIEPRRLRHCMVFAVPLSKVTVEVSSLPEGCQLLTKEVHSPGSSVVLVFKAQGERQLEALQASLHTLTLRFSALVDSRHVQEIRLPKNSTFLNALEQAYAAGVLTPEEFDQKRQKVPDAHPITAAFDVTVHLTTLSVQSVCLPDDDVILYENIL